MGSGTRKSGELSVQRRWWGVTWCASSSRPARRLGADAGFRCITQRSGSVVDCNDDNDAVGGCVSCGCGAMACVPVCVCVCTVVNEWMWTSEMFIGGNMCLACVCCQSWKVKNESLITFSTHIWWLLILVTFRFRFDTHSLTNSSRIIFLFSLCHLSFCFIHPSVLPPFLHTFLSSFCLLCPFLVYFPPHFHSVSFAVFSPASVLSFLSQKIWKHQNPTSKSQKIFNQQRNKTIVVTRYFTTFDCFVRGTTDNNSRYQFVCG